MLIYYALYKIDINHPPPTGIMVYEGKTGDGLVWSHRQKAWVYDRRTTGAMIWNYEYDDRVEEISRERAEEVAREITKATTGFVQELPDEETIYWIFQWKGEPPQASEE